MKGNNCGFLHQFDKSRMPTCRFFAKYNECREPDCPFKHSLEDVKDCNMYKLGFCIHGPNCRYRHAKQDGPPPGIQEAALHRPPRPPPRRAPSPPARHMQNALALRQDQGPGAPGGPGGGGGAGGAGGAPGGGRLPPPLPPGPPPSSVRRMETPMALPDAPGARGAGVPGAAARRGGGCAGHAGRGRRGTGESQPSSHVETRGHRGTGESRFVSRGEPYRRIEKRETRTTPAERVAFGMARRDAFRVEFSVALFRPRSSFYFPHSSSSPQSSSASSHSFVFFSSAGAGLSLPLAEPESTLPPPFDPDAAD